MTALSEHLRARIARHGPMTVAEYMTECLLNPKHGYYATRDPFGVTGDFVTAPEVSQMFGEVLGLCLAQAWIDRGKPEDFLLVELGPGRGTLMADILRSAGAVPGFADAAEVHLVETSPVLRNTQSKTIPAAISHHDQIDTLPDGPLFLIANEFFDALPVRQFLKDGDAWRERVIGLDGEALAFGLTDHMRPEFLQEKEATTKNGDLVEVSKTAEAVAGEIGARLATTGGLALIIDYGAWGSLGDTFQAVRAHEKVGPLDTPGDADLTAHVDFEALANAAAPAVATKATPQGVFLERLGITARANALAGASAPDVVAGIASAHRRLTHPDEMGNLFKAMALYRANDPPPAGFDP